MYVSELIELRGLDPKAKVKLVRHLDTKRNVDELLIRDWSSFIRRVNRSRSLNVITSLHSQECLEDAPAFLDSMRHGRLFERNGGNVLVLGENKSNGPQSVPPIQRLPGGVPTNSEGALPCNQHERFRTRPCRTKPKAHPCCLCGRRIRSFLFFRSRTMSSKIRRARHLDSLLPGIFDHSRAKSSIPRPVCHSWDDLPSSFSRFRTIPSKDRFQMVAPVSFPLGKKSRSLHEDGFVLTFQFPVVGEIVFCLDENLQDRPAHRRFQTSVFFRLILARQYFPKTTIQVFLHLNGKLIEGFGID